MYVYYTLGVLCRVSKCTVISWRFSLSSHPGVLTCGTLKKWPKLQFGYNIIQDPTYGYSLYRYPCESFVFPDVGHSNVTSDVGLIHLYLILPATDDGHCHTHTYMHAQGNSQGKVQHNAFIQPLGTQKNLPSILDQCIYIKVQQVEIYVEIYIYIYIFKCRIKLLPPPKWFTKILTVR